MAAYHNRHTMERMRAHLARADRELRTAEHFLDPGSTEVAEMDMIRAAAPVYLEDVNDRGVVMLVTRHKDQSQFSRYFYSWSLVGWIRLAEDDERCWEVERER
jgi:hypothetical protein